MSCSKCSDQAGDAARKGGIPDEQRGATWGAGGGSEQGGVAEGRKRCGRCGRFVTSSGVCVNPQCQAAFDGAIQALQVGGSDERVYAVDTLRDIGGEDAETALIHAFASDEDWSVRWGAIDALGDMGGDRAAIELSRLLGEEQDCEIRQRCATSLGNIGGQWAVSGLVDVAHQDPDLDVREEAKAQLACIARHDTDSEVRVLAVDALARFSDSAEAVDALAKALGNDESFDVRWSAAEALGDIGGEDAETALIQALREEQDCEIRQHCVQMLGGLKGGMGRPAISALTDAAHKDEDWDVRKEAKAQLAHRLLHDKDDLVRGSAAMSLGEIGDSQAIPALSKALARDASHQVRSDAAYALGQMDDKRAASALIGAINDESATVRFEVVQAMGRSSDVRVLEPLNAALEDRNQDVRWAAFRAIEKDYDDEEDWE